MENEKHYDSDEAKAKSRNLEKLMLEKTLLKATKPGKVKVLFFPGVDAAEVFQVFDPLGIPRANLVGIERERDIAQHLQGKNLGITIVNQKVEDYIRAQREMEFNVVSLDYTQPLHNSELEAIHNILTKTKRNQLVLHVANSVRRDASSDGIYRAGLIGADISQLNTPQKSEDYYEQMVKVMDSFEVKLDSGESRKEEKAHAFSKTLKSTWSGFGYKYDDGKPNSSDVLPKLEKIIKFLADEETLSLMSAKIKVQAEDILQVPIEFDPSRPITTFPYPGYVMHIAPEWTRFLTRARVEELGLTDKFGEEVFRALMTVVKDRSFFSNSAEINYSYISESGCPMIGDIIFLKRPVYYSNHAIDAVTQIGFPTRFGIRDKNEFLRKLSKFLVESIDLSKERQRILAELNLEGRVFLGNSYKPLITKEQFAAETAAGKPIDQIKREYRGWQAFVREESYAASNNGELVDRSIVSGKLEALTEQEKEDVLSLGIPESDVKRVFDSPVEAPKQASVKYKFSADEKQKIRTLRAEGKSVDEIYSHFDHAKVTKAQVGSVAAWVKINRDRAGQNPTVSDSTTANASLVRTEGNVLYQPTPKEEEEIRYFLAEGSPDEQIIGAYHLSTMQLAARKASITREKNKKNGVNGTSDAVFRRETLERDGYKCQMPDCGVTQDTHLSDYNHGLHVHHIDYNHGNNDPKNRITLCVKHHGMTNTVQHAHKLREILEARIDQIYQPKTDFAREIHDFVI